MLISALTSLALLATRTEDPIHPAFMLSKASFDAVWDKGTKEGQKKHDAKSAIGKFQRQIDSYHTSPIKKEPCSWALLMHPRLLVYLKANQSALQYWTEDEVTKAKNDLAQYADAESEFLGFYVTINEMPSFAAPYGRLSRYADPENLKDVRCVLKVGDRIIQPDKQPGDLTVSRSDEVNLYSIPTTTYIRGRSNTTANAYGKNGSYAYGSSSTASSYTVTTHSIGSQDYSTYSSNFIVLFPTRDKDGKPLITPNDKDIEIKVVKKSGELKTTFPLKDWVTAFEK